MSAAARLLPASQALSRPGPTRPNRGRILVGMFVPHALIEMKPVLEACIAAGWRIGILLGYEGATSDAVVEWANDAGASIHRIPSNFAYGGTCPEEALPEFMRAIPGPVGKALRACGLLGKRYRHLRRCIGWIEAFVGRMSPDVLLMHNFQSCGRADVQLLMTCCRRGVPSACMMVSPIVSRQVTMRARPAQYRVGMIPPNYRVDHDSFNRLIARLRPEWIVREGDLALFFAHPLEMAAAWLAGVLPRDVWQVPSEKYSVVFVQTKRARERLLDGAYPLDKIVCVGTPRLEETYRMLADPARVDLMYRRLGLPTGTAFVLWNMEPSWEHHYSTEEFHWARVENIRGILHRLGLPVVISLHPLCKLQNYEFLEQTPNIRISRDYGIHILYPLSAFSISFGCSTDRFADSFGKTVVFFDWVGESTHPGRWRELQTSDMEVARTFDELDLAIGNVARRTTGSGQGMVPPIAEAPCEAILMHIDQLVAASHHLRRHGAAA